MSLLFRQGYQGLSLSGAGWLLPFHIGTLDALRSAGEVSENTPLAGASGKIEPNACACAGSSSHVRPKQRASDVASATNKGELSLQPASHRASLAMR